MGMTVRRFILPNTDIRERCVEAIREAPDAPLMEVVIKQHKSSGSTEQRNFYWAVVREISNHLGYPPAELHEAFKQLYLTPTVIAMGKGDEVLDVTVPPSTTRLNKKEFVEYLDRVLQFAAEHGVSIDGRDKSYGG